MTTTSETTVVVNYYDVLGLSASATAEEVRARYVELALEKHPDRFADPEQKADAAEKFKRIHLAYEVLRDPDERARFDVSLRLGRAFSPGHEVASGDSRLADILADFDRYPFPSNATTYSLGLLGDQASLLDTTLIKASGLEERILHGDGGIYARISELPLHCIRGASTSYSLVFTNLRLICLCRGTSSLTEGDVKHTRTYNNSIGFRWSAIEKIEIRLTPSGGKDGDFVLLFFGPHLPLSGAEIHSKGSVFPLLWVAEQYGIDIDVIFKTRSAATAIRWNGALASGLLAIAGIWLWTRGAPLLHWIDIPTEHHYFMTVLSCILLMLASLTTFISDLRQARDTALIQSLGTTLPDERT